MARIRKDDHPRILHMIEVEHRKVADVAVEFGCTPANIYSLVGKLRRQTAAVASPEPVQPPLALEDVVAPQGSVPATSDRVAEAAGGSDGPDASSGRVAVEASLGTGICEEAPAAELTAGTPVARASKASVGGEAALKARAERKNGASKSPAAAPKQTATATTPDRNGSIAEPVEELPAEPAPPVASAAPTGATATSGPAPAPAKSSQPAATAERSRNVVAFEAPAATPSPKSGRPTGGRRGGSGSGAVGAKLAKPGYGLVMRTPEGEESLTPFRSLDDLLSAIKPILRAAASSPEPVWFSLQPVDLASIDMDAA